MTMQTTTLPFQVSGASAQAQPPRNAAAGVRAPAVQAQNAGQFGATLSREIAQRQAPAPAPSSASGTANKPAAAKPQPADKPATQGPKTAAREPEKRQEAVADAPSTAPASAGLDAAEATQDAESAAAAATAAAEAAAVPVTDMLAFMASLAQPVVAVAAPVVAEVAVAATGAGLQMAALESAFAKLETTVDVGADPALATATAQEGDGAAAGFALATGVQPAAPLEAADLRALQQTAQAAVPADPKPLQGQARELAGPAAAVVEAPAPAITQLQAAAAKLDVANPAAVPADRIPARVGTQAWDNQVSQRIVYMVGKEQAATLTLNPPDLGPVQVVLSVSNEGTSVAFSSNELEVRQALENALPRLREMMSESGIALGKATVDAGTQQFTQEQRQAQDGERRNGHGGARFGDGPATAANDAAPRTRTVAVGDSGMVDTFA